MGFELSKFAARMSAIRAARRMTGEQLAEQTGLSLSTIRRYEGGKSEPDFSGAAAIAEALGCSLDELAGLTPAEITIN